MFLLTEKMIIIVLITVAIYISSAVFKEYFLSKYLHKYKKRKEHG